MVEQNQLERYNRNGSRFYTDGDMEAPSVTTLISSELEEDNSGLRYWKKNNDGTDNSPFHHHLYWFSAPLGTLCHYEALKQFADGLHGDEERRSLNQIKDGPDEEVSQTWYEAGVPSDPGAIAYSIQKKRDWTDVEQRGDDVPHPTSIAQQDIEWFVDQFEKACEQCGVNEQTVLHVEKYLLTEYAGGQCDLVYLDGGTPVVVDLKTSSGFRQKHLLQIHAYGMMLEDAPDVPFSEIGRHEVWRFNPERREVAIHSDDESRVEPNEEERDIPRHVDGFYEDDYGDWEYDGRDDVRETFKELCNSFTDEDDSN